MHELSIASEVLRLCAIEREARGAGPLREVVVAVGELSSVDGGALAHAWDALAPDARLTVDWRPARQLCSACGEVEERQPGSWLRLCPRCSGALRLEGGTELDLLRIVFEDAAEAAGVRA